MNISVALYFLTDSEEEEEEQIVQLTRRHLRDMYNVLDMPSNQFVSNFRVSKEIFQMILGKFEPCVRADRISRIRADVKLATFLRFLATGSYQQTVGKEVVSSTCKATVSRIVKECLMFFEDNMCADWIKMPRPEEENNIKHAFYASNGFPGIIGCVDGMHIRIKPPVDEIKHLYYTRRGYYSINAMVICDHNTKILYVDARHPGDNDDTFVWELSAVDARLQVSFESGKINTWILGDADYKLKPYLMTPIRNPSDAAERLYNKKHACAHNVIGCCFGILKNRFRCIIDSRRLHYSSSKTTKIVNVCCALHNMCLHFKCPEPKYIEPDVAEDREEAALFARAASIRRNIAINL